MDHTTGKISILPLALSLGIVWGGSMLFVGLIGDYFSLGKNFVDAMGSIYIGYTTTFGGSLLGGLYGFLDGFIFGVLIAWFYNFFSKKWHK